MPNTMSEAEVRQLAKIASLIAEKSPRLTDQFYRVMRALHQDSQYASHNFMKLCEGARVKDNCNYTEKERRDILASQSAIFLHGSKPLPEVEGIEAGPLVELRNSLKLDNEQLSCVLRISVEALVLMNSGEQPIDKKTAKDAYLIALENEDVLRPSLLEWLEYIAFDS